MRGKEWFKRIPDEMSSKYILGTFRGKNVIFTEERYDGEKSPNRFYYEMRHSDRDWSCPVTIEKRRVVVNFWGTLITDEPLIFPAEDDPYIELTQKESELFGRGCIYD